MEKPEKEINHVLQMENDTDQTMTESTGDETPTGPTGPSSPADASETKSAPSSPAPSIVHLPAFYTTSAAGLVDAARKWMEENYGTARAMNPDWYQVRLGFLIEFITAVFGDLTSCKKK